MSFVDDRRCFLCGPENDRGLHIEFGSQDGRAWADVVLPDLVQGYRETVHGGIVSALLDEAMFYALHSLGFWGATAELSVRFRRPTPVGRPVRVQAEVVRLDGRLGVARAELRQQGELLASASGKFLATPRHEAQAN
jgi:uncharacterized protein (TIGR00369 family)